MTPLTVSDVHTRQHIKHLMATRSHRVFKVKAKAVEYSLSLFFFYFFFLKHIPLGNTRLMQPTSYNLKHKHTAECSNM